jgi:hypothetical protein
VPVWQYSKDSEEIMLNIKTIAFSAMFALGAWAVAALVGFGALAIASNEVPMAQSIAAPQIDTVSLMAKAGDLPVEIAPMP